MSDESASQKFDDLLGRLRDGTAGPAEWAEFEHLIATDPALRRRHIEHAQLRAELRARFAPPEKPGTEKP